jgi:geranylgeranyl pyrophosphate synthase
MHVPILTLPRAVPDQRERPPQVNIPQTKIERDRLAAAVREYVAAERPVPPLPVAELRAYADRLVGRTGLDPVYRDYAAVLINNEAWRDSLAGIPYNRRLLLLPKCLRYEAKCPAPFDEFGLLCKRCGLCSIQDLQDEAERLGYAVLVAEGSAIVMAIIQTGKIEAIVGVSCLSVLEKAFPQMEAAAIPGIAIPLLQDDCVDTGVDLDWVWDVVHLTSDDRTYRLDLDGIRSQVESWFAPDELNRHLGPVTNETDRIAREWLTKSGKRWRPFLTACAFIALDARDTKTRDGDQAIPDALRRIAIAVECFHKASLVHDDIEDGDETRYGDETLHARYGVPIALNVGDFLLGEGYRLLAEVEAPAHLRGELLRLAAIGHRTLSEGQGAELSWMANRRPLSSLQVLDIFRRKTAPAFEVALRLGAVFAEAEPSVHDVIARYSEALGIAYQIRDDLDDWTTEAARARGIVAPSIVLAVALERARTRDAEAAARLVAAWQGTDAAPAFDLTGPAGAEGGPHNLEELILRVGAMDRCRQLFESYKEEAVRSLAALDNASLKGLLRRVVGKIFNDIELKGWCSEFEARNAAGRAPGAEAAV